MDTKSKAEELRDLHEKYKQDSKPRIEVAVDDLYKQFQDLVIERGPDAHFEILRVSHSDHYVQSNGEVVFINLCKKLEEDGWGTNVLSRTGNPIGFRIEKLIVFE